MEEACNAAGKPCPGEQANGKLFYCVYGRLYNSIEYRTDCSFSGVCEDGGAGKTDHCTYK
jgi:hypothetical protein